MDLILQDVHRGFNVKVNSRAGCGKTTLLLKIAQAVNEKCIILTYNRALCEQAQSRLKSQGIENCTCHTIHALFGLQAGVSCSTDAGLLYDGPVETLDCGIVMIDEAQDLRPSLFDAIRRMVPVAQFVVCGDDCQVLYSYIIGDAASADYMDNIADHLRPVCIRSEWREHVLSGSYRMTPSIAEVAAAVFQTPITSLSTEQDVPVQYLIINPFDRQVTATLQNLIDVHGPDEVMILGRSVMGAGNAIRHHVNRLCTRQYRFNIKEYARGFDNCDWKGKTRVWTFCGSKGCESKVVVIFGIDRCDLTMDLGVAVSRASKHLIFIHAPHVPVHEGLRSLAGTHMIRWDGSSWGAAAPQYGPYTEYVSTTRRRRKVTERTNMSAQLIRSMVQGLEILKEHVHNAHDICTFACIGDDSEDMSALYGKALEYLIQVRCKGTCPNASVCTLAGSAFTTLSSVHEWLERHSIEHDPRDIEHLCIPISCARLRALLNTGELKLGKASLPYFAADRTNQLTKLHAKLIEDRSPTTAIRLANQYLALDNYSDRVCMTHYNWVDEQALGLLFENATATFSDLHNGTFEHGLSYKDELFGRVDWAGGTRIIEIKFTKEITDEHFLQLGLYAYMHCMQTGADTEAILYNVLLGCKWTMHASLQDADPFLQRYLDMLQE